MRTGDLIGTAVGNTFRAKLRTSLTVIAILIGAFTLTLTTAVGSGVSAYVTTQVASIGATNSITVTKTGIKLASNVTFSVDVPTTFLRVINFNKLTVSGLSSSAATLPPYLDFYLTLDVSGSMGLPSTGAEQTRLSQVNPDNYRQYPTGCVFACPDTWPSPSPET